jgi:drug/metabolite transporter (DMT)-like permease
MLKTRCHTKRKRMGDKKVIGAVLLVVGAVLLYFGFQASDAPLEQARESLTGEYSDRTMLYLIGGAAAAVGGLALLVMGRR